MSIDEKAFWATYKRLELGSAVLQHVIETYLEESAKTEQPLVATTERGDEKTKRMYSDIAEEHLYAKSNLEDKLLELGLTDWNNLWTDPYDNSIELDGVDNDNRLSPEAQKFLRDQGFSICWLTHKDGMETAYYKLEGEKGSRKKSLRAAMKQTPTPHPSEGESGVVMELVAEMEASKHENPNHPRGVGFNEGLDEAIVLVRKFGGKL